MTVATIYIIASVIIVSIVSLVGIAVLSLNRNFLYKCVTLMVALAIGALLGDAFFHLIPEAYENSRNTSTVSLLILFGMLIFFVLEKAFNWHHGQHDDHQGHSDTIVAPLGKMIIISDGIHNFLDGVIIAVSYLVSIELGIATTFAIIMHEIPQEIGDFGVLMHAGYTRARALLYNFFSALLAVAGALIVLVIGEASGTIVQYMVPIAAGSFIYIASSDLTPELHKAGGARGILQFIVMLAGIGAMYLLLFLE